MRRRYLEAGGIALAVVLLFYLLLLKPKFGQMTDVKAEVATAQQETQSLKLRLAQLQAAAKSDADTQDRLKTIRRLLPSAPNLPALIRDLQGSATNSGMDLVSIAPSPPSVLSNATGIEVINVNLLVTGGFFRLETFLTRLEDPLKRVVEIQSLSIAPATDPLTGLTTLSTTINFKMYVVQENAKASGPALAPSRPANPTPTLSPTPTATATR